MNTEESDRKFITGMLIFLSLVLMLAVLGAFGWFTGMWDRAETRMQMQTVPAK